MRVLSQKTRHLFWKYQKNTNKRKQKLDNAVEPAGTESNKMKNALDKDTMGICKTGTGKCCKAAVLWGVAALLCRTGALFVVSGAAACEQRDNKTSAATTIGRTVTPPAGVWMSVVGVVFSGQLSLSACDIVLRFFISRRVPSSFGCRYRSRRPRFCFLAARKCFSIEETASSAIVFWRSRLVDCCNLSPSSLDSKRNEGLMRRHRLSFIISLSIEFVEKGVLMMTKMPEFLKTNSPFSSFDSKRTDSCIEKSFVWLSIADFFDLFDQHVDSSRFNESSVIGGDWFRWRLALFLAA